MDKYAPQAKSDKNRFGKATFYWNIVRLLTGAAYALPGVDKEFRGKRLDPSSNRVHFVAVFDGEKQNGETYQAVRDCLTNEDDYQIIHPTIIEHFGQNIAAIDGKPFEAQLVEVPNGRVWKDTTLTFWKIVSVFKTKAERVAATEAFFTQSNEKGNGIPADVIDFAKQVKGIADKSHLNFGELVTSDERLSKYGTEALLEAMK